MMPGLEESRIRLLGYRDTRIGTLRRSFKWSLNFHRNGILKDVALKQNPHLKIKHIL